MVFSTVYKTDSLITELLTTLPERSAETLTESSYTYFNNWHWSLEITLPTSWYKAKKLEGSTNIWILAKGSSSTSQACSNVGIAYNLSLLSLIHTCLTSLGRKDILSSFQIQTKRLMWMLVMPGMVGYLFNNSKSSRKKAWLSWMGWFSQKILPYCLSNLRSWDLSCKV